MSSHYIYVACPAEGCAAVEGIYTGNADLDRFGSSQYEGEFVYVGCDEHTDAAMPSAGKTRENALREAIAAVGADLFECCTKGRDGLTPCVDCVMRDNAIADIEALIGGESS